MALNLPSIGTWFAKTQSQVFENATATNEQYIKIALTNQLNRRVFEIQAKYDGADLAELETKINSLLQKKQTVGTQLDAVKRALDKIDDVRVGLLAAQAAVDAASPATFDTELDNINRTAGRTTLDPTNLIGSTGKGSWVEKNTVVSSGRFTTTVKTQYLGSDYVIDTAGGTRADPDHTARTLDGVDFDTITLNSLSGNTVSYNDGSTDIDGEIRRGGIGVLNAWAYNNFATATDQANAQADINAGFEYIADVEKNLTNNLNALNTMFNNIGFDVENTTDKYNDLNVEQLEARGAELKAARVQFELTLNSFSLLSSNQLTLVSSIFTLDDPAEKQTVFGIING